MIKQVDKMQQILGTKLISLIEFSRGSKREYILITKGFQYETLKPLRKLIKKFPVMIFTQEDFEGGVDVFPVDMALIKEDHVLLAGKDLVSGIEIKSSDLRHHLEYSLRSQRVYLKTQAVYEGAKKLAPKVYGTIHPNLIAALIYKKSKSAKIKLTEGIDLHKSIKEVYGIDTKVLDHLKDPRSHAPEKLLRETDTLLTELINHIN